MSVVLQPQVSQTASKTAEARRSQFFDSFVSPVTFRINQMTKLVQIPPFLHFLPMLLQRQEDRGSPAVAVSLTMCQCLRS